MIESIISKPVNATKLPALIDREDRRMGERFLEFFTANIRNPNTRRAYARAVGQFLNWCEDHDASLHEIKPILVAAYIEQHPGSIPTIKQHMAAINMLFDWLVTGQIVPLESCSSSARPSLQRQERQNTGFIS